LRKGGRGVAGEPGGAAAGTEVLRYLSEIWQERMGERTPLAHEFVTEHRERWVRFHSLPESKRYASDQAERRTILERHYTVLGELFGDEDVVLMTTKWSYTPVPEPPAGRPEAWTGC
jgi:hypothetical protein